MTSPMTPPAQDPNIVTKAEFARTNGWGKSYVSRLVGEGRLVLTEDGKVLAAESLQRIQDTTNATERASPPAVPTQVRADRDRKEFYDAENARLDLEERTRKLMQRADAVAVAADVGVFLRTTLEAWADTIAADLSALNSDENRIRGLLRDRVHELLGDVSRRFAKLADAGVKG